MASNLPDVSPLPASVREGVDRFCAELHQALGDQLVSLILYGGLARGEYAPHSSDVNVMAALTEVTIEALDKMVAPVQQGIREFRLSLMVLSENDLARSTDAFPIKFMDMQQHYQVLWGKDVLTELSVGKDHLRLRCEQELKNLLFRLRQFYLRRSHQPEFIEATLTKAISSFLTGLRVLLILKTGQSPDGKQVIATSAVRELALDEKPLQDVLALKAGQYKPEAVELKQLYGAFMAVVQKAVDIVDQL